MGREREETEILWLLFSNENQTTILTIIFISLHDGGTSAAEALRRLTFSYKKHSIIFCAILQFLNAPTGGVGERR